MPLKYVEKSPNRILALLEVAGDTTPFISVGTGQNQHTRNGYAKGSNERRLDEFLRLSIRPVLVGGKLTMDKPIPGLKISGQYADAANIQHVAFGQRERIELPQDGTIDAGFEIIHKRRLDMTEDEAYCLQTYPALIYGGGQCIIDETDGPGGSGFYAIRMNEHTSGIYAVEMLVDDFTD